MAVATDARLTKTETYKLAQLAANGLIRTVRPSYTTVDGDMVFALSCGEREVALDVVGAAAMKAAGARDLPCGHGGRRWRHRSRLEGHIF